MKAQYLLFLGICMFVLVDWVFVRCCAGMSLSSTVAFTACLVVFRLAVSFSLPRIVDSRKVSRPRWWIWRSGIRGGRFEDIAPLTDTTLVVGLLTVISEWIGGPKRMSIFEGLRAVSAFSIVAIALQGIDLWYRHAFSLFLKNPDET